MSEGRLLSTRAGGEWLPESLPRVVVDVTRGVPFHAERRVDPGWIRDALAVPLDPARRSFFSFPTTAVYSPVPYLPQAAAMLLGRAAGLPALWLLYLGRLANLAAAAALLSFAIGRLPGLRWFGVTLSSAPMVVFLRSSLSGDALGFALAMVVAATWARLAADGGRGSRPDRVALAAAAPALCLTKPPMALLALSILALWREPSQRRLARGVLLGCALATATSIAFALHLQVSLRPGAGVDPAGQLRAILADPSAFLLALAEVAGDLPRYAAELIGRLGWLDTPLPVPVLAAYLTTLVFLALCDGGPGSGLAAGARGAVTVAVAASAAATITSQYLVWTPVGAPYLEGFQGRHILPVAAFAAWAWPSRWRALGVPERYRVATSLTAVALGLLATVSVLVARYYGPSAS